MSSSHRWTISESGLPRSDITIFVACLLIAAVGFRREIKKHFRTKGSAPAAVTLSLLSMAVEAIVRTCRWISILRSAKPLTPFHGALGPLFLRLGLVQILCHWSSV